MKPDPAAALPIAEQTREQLRYALWLDWGTRLGLVVLVVSFAAYLLGALPPRMAPQQLVALWHLPVAELTRVSGAPTGWAWIRNLHQGDMTGLLGIALLASCSLPSLLALLPLYLRAGDRAFAALCLAQVTVLLLAASGVLGAGH